MYSDMYRYEISRVMNITTYTEFRQKLASFLDRIEADRTPLIVTILQTVII